GPFDDTGTAQERMDLGGDHRYRPRVCGARRVGTRDCPRLRPSCDRAALGFAGHADGKHATLRRPANRTGSSGELAAQWPKLLARAATRPVCRPSLAACPAVRAILA